MPDSANNMTRYLLGELSESERAALEEKYFADPEVFEQVLKSESELLDGYVRGQLSAEARQRFEQTYLTHPKRRERLKFAEALVTRIDQNEISESIAKPPEAVLGWRELFGLAARRPVLEFSLALASLLLLVVGVLFFIESRRSRQELAQAQSDRAVQEARVRELEQRIAAERQRTEELTAQLDRQQQPTPQTQTTPPATSRTLPTLASLILTVGGVRGSESGKAPTLVIPAGTAEVKIQLNLKEHDYAGYRVSLQAVGGPEIFSSGGLKHRTSRSGASLTIIVPTGKFGTGDYMLTLRGISQDGQNEDLSKSLFRVEKR